MKGHPKGSGLIVVLGLLVLAYMIQHNNVAGQTAASTIIQFSDSEAEVFS